jgi:hypothetical protein
MVEAGIPEHLWQVTKDALEGDVRDYETLAMGGPNPEMDAALDFIETRSALPFEQALKTFENMVSKKIQRDLKRKPRVSGSGSKRTILVKVNPWAFMKYKPLDLVNIAVQDVKALGYGPSVRELEQAALKLMKPVRVQFEFSFNTASTPTLTTEMTVTGASGNAQKAMQSLLEPLVKRAELVMGTKRPRDVYRITLTEISQIGTLLHEVKNWKTSYERFQFLRSLVGPLTRQFGYKY